MLKLLSIFLTSILLVNADPLQVDLPDGDNLKLKIDPTGKKSITVKVDGKEIVVTADRLLSVGKIKSALSLNVKAVVQQSNRTESNPYGLILSSVSQIEEKEEK